MTNVVPNVVLEFLPDDTKIACPLQTPDLCNRGILIVECTTVYTVLFGPTWLVCPASSIYVYYTFTRHSYNKKNQALMS